MVLDSQEKKHNCESHAIIEHIMKSFADTVEKMNTKLDAVLEGQRSSGQLCLLREHELKTLSASVHSHRGDVQQFEIQHDRDIAKIWEEIDILRKEDAIQGKEIASINGASGMAKWLIPIGIGMVGGVAGSAVTVILTLMKK